MDQRAPHICIADRNRNVSEFLRRQFVEAGYHVQVARHFAALKWILAHHPAVDLLVLDPEFGGFEGADLLEEVLAQSPGLPVVLHSFAWDQGQNRASEKAAAFVEKMPDTHALVDTVNRLTGHETAFLSDKASYE